MPGLDQARQQDYLARVSALIGPLVDTMEAFRAMNGGGLSFWLDRAGHAFALDPDKGKVVLELDPTRSNSSDLFYSKGLLAAAAFLGDASRLATAQVYFDKVVDDIENGRFYSDQEAFDPKNPVGEVANRYSHGARMLAIGGLELALRVLGPADTADPVRGMHYAATGLRLIRHILDCHVNLDGRFPGLADLDFVECIDGAGNPYVADGDVMSDTGHALEFVGLSLKFLERLIRMPDLPAEQRAQAADYRAALPQLLLHNFQLGFNERVGGICKTYSLTRRQPLNSDMPWWNLPETMRAALLAYHAADADDTRAAVLNVGRLCSNAFLGNYVNPAVYLMAYQTLDENGTPIRVVPATPDLDPGYHTGLSIIDFLEAVAR